jgi:hypothetical protein
LPEHINPAVANEKLFKGRQFNKAKSSRKEKSLLTYILTMKILKLKDRTQVVLNNIESKIIETMFAMPRKE